MTTITARPRPPTDPKKFIDLFRPASEGSDEVLVREPIGPGWAGNRRGYRISDGGARVGASTPDGTAAGIAPQARPHHVRRTEVGAG
jgi:hypothetical protein